MQSGDEGWVERYRRMGYRNFFEEGRHPDFGKHTTIAYGEPDQEAPWLAAGRITVPTVSLGPEGAYLNFALDSGAVEHHFRVNADLCEVLWKGL